MSRDQIQQRVIEMAADYFAEPAASITESSKLVADLGADDLDVTQFMYELEDEFEVRLDDPEDDEAVTIGTLTEGIQTQLERASNA